MQRTPFQQITEDQRKEFYDAIDKVTDTDGAGMIIIIDLINNRRDIEVILGQNNSSDEELTDALKCILIDVKKNGTKNYV